MRSRLDDLIATAERQLAARSYEAAIDTYRTALAEPGAKEAGVAERLEAACRARDETRGLVRAAPAVAVEIAPPVESPVLPPVEPEPDRAPEPAAPRPVSAADPPIEPPSFYLVEDSPSRPDFGREEENPGVKRESFLDATPLLEGEGGLPFLGRLVVAALIAAATVFVVYLFK